MFIMDLALALGKSKKELFTSMDSEELSEWFVYWKARKIMGVEREDYRTGMIIHTLISCFTKKGSKVAFTDCIPFYEKQLPTQSGLVSKLLGWVGKFKRKRKGE